MCGHVITWCIPPVYNYFLDRSQTLVMTAWISTASQHYWFFSLLCCVTPAKTDFGSFLAHYTTILFQVKSTPGWFHYETPWLVYNPYWQISHYHPITSATVRGTFPRPYRVAELTLDFWSCRFTLYIFPLQCKAR